MSVCPSPVPLTVVIITLNEALRIGDCLDSVRMLAEDVVVVDAGSSDHTRAICQEKGARVFTRAWRGYSAQKNFGNAQARHDWILSLDADERLSPDLARSICELFARGPSHDAFALRFHNFLGDHRVRFGAWNPESHVRLFDRRKFCWNDADVHEGLRATSLGRCGHLDGAVLHFTARSRSQLAAKQEIYAALFAEKARREGRQASWVKLWLNPAWRFLRDYFVLGGVLDGMVGWQIAYENARYTRLKYCKIADAPAWGRAHAPVARKNSQVLSHSNVAS